MITGTWCYGGKAQHYLLSCTPVRTQPNWVLSAVGDPWGHSHQPWSITWLKMSALTCNRMSTPSGTPNHWSSSCNPCRCFHFVLKGTGEVGNFIVTLGSTVASTLQQCPEDVPALLELATRNETMEWDTLCALPPMQQPESIYAVEPVGVGNMEWNHGVRHAVLLATHASNLKVFTLARQLQLLH